MRILYNKTDIKTAADDFNIICYKNADGSFCFALIGAYSLDGLDIDSYENELREWLKESHDKPANYLVFVSSPLFSEENAVKKLNYSTLKSALVADDDETAELVKGYINSSFCLFPVSYETIQDEIAAEIKKQSRLHL